MSCDPQPKLNSTAALAAHKLHGPYVEPMTYSASQRSPEFSMSKPGFRRETNAGNESGAAAKAELDC